MPIEESKQQPVTVSEEVDGADVIDSLSLAQMANVVGSRAVEIAVEAGIIDDDNVLDVGETRHAQWGGSSHGPS